MFDSIRTMFGRWRQRHRRASHSPVPSYHSERLDRLQKLRPDMPVLDMPRYELGDHPRSYRDFECAFAACHVPSDAHVLDVGSYRLFILGLLGRGPVTTLDVRPRMASGPFETVLTGDARQIPLNDRSVDCVVTLSSIEHFGLGRYGDPFDPEGDRKAMAEMIRVLRSGGTLVCSTSLTRGQASIVFPRHRIYTLQQIHGMCKGLDLVAEEYFSRSLGEKVSFDRITGQTGQWDVYCGCWRKP